MSASVAARMGAKRALACEHAIAIASHPQVTRIAADVMRDGGNACDAALAAAVAQTVLEPHMTTLTGVLSMLHFEAASGAYTYVNGSAAAPAARPDAFTPADAATGLGVAVPGWWGGFEAALARHGSGQFTRERLLAPAIALAHEGFEVYPFLYASAYENLAELCVSEQGREIFMPQGTLLTPGERIVQRRVGETLERLAADGAEYYYRGELAQRLVDTVARAGGVLTRADMERYEARWMEPARGTYRGLDVIGSPPPDQGGTHLIEMLNMVELLDLAALGHPLESPEALALLIRIHNEVYTAGANQRDPRSHPLPLETIVSKEYARMRFELLRMAEPLSPPVPPPPGSNHMTVVDPAGNVVTLLHSCMCRPWVNGLYVDGLSVSAAGSHYLRTLPEPGDRITSIIVPSMLAADGVPLLAGGSPSQSLLATVLQNVVNIVDFGMDIERSVHLPRFGGPGPYTADTWRGIAAAGTMIEADVAEDVRAAVAARGIALTPVSPWHHMCGSFEGVLRDRASGRLSACGDPRRTSEPAGF